MRRAIVAIVGLLVATDARAGTRCSCSETRTIPRSGPLEVPLNTKLRVINDSSSDRFIVRNRDHEVFVIIVPERQIDGPTNLAAFPVPTLQPHTDYEVEGPTRTAEFRTGSYVDDTPPQKPVIDRLNIEADLSDPQWVGPIRIDLRAHVSADTTLLEWRIVDTTGTARSFVTLPDDWPNCDGVRVAIGPA